MLRFRFCAGLNLLIIEVFIINVFDLIRIGVVEFVGVELIHKSREPHEDEESIIF